MNTVCMYVWGKKPSMILNNSFTPANAVNIPDDFWGLLGCRKDVTVDFIKIIRRRQQYSR